MLTTDSYKHFLQKIIDTHLAEEAIAFQIEGEGMVSDILSQEWSGHQEGHADKYGFADLATSKTVLDIALVAFSSFKVLSEIRLLRAKKTEKTVDTKAVQKRWRQRLREAGVKAPLAQAITKDFINDLVALSDH
jgi:uncharacterized protein (DUF849 family)